MQKWKTFFFGGLAVCTALTSTSRSAARAATMTVTGKSEFLAIGKPSAIKIHGEGDGLSGNLDVKGTQVSGTVKFPLNQFGTGVALRDEHMKEKYLETQKFPSAQLTIDKVQVAQDPSKEGFNQKEVPFTGTLTLHGVTKPVSGKIDIATSGQTTTGEAQFEMKTSDFNIAVPKYLGITVTDTVQVSVHLQATKSNGGA
jgi:polyisoprenoid-binding protein YceI